MKNFCTEDLILQLSDQIKEKGYHQNGIKEGLTTYYYTDGKMQREGFLKNGSPNGVWTYWNNKGEKDFEFDFGSDLEHIILNQLVERESTFYKPGEDKPYTGVITDENSDAGYLFLGKTKNGKKDGTWKGWYFNGNKFFERNYKNGEKEGSWSWWYDNNNLKYSGYYSSGIKNGKWIEYNSDKKIYFCENEYEADLKVFFVDYKYQITVLMNIRHVFVHS